MHGKTTIKISLFIYVLMVKIWQETYCVVVTVFEVIIVTAQ
jgi:hypothetical protein